MAALAASVVPLAVSGALIIEKSAKVAALRVAVSGYVGIIGCAGSGFLRNQGFQMLSHRTLRMPVCVDVAAAPVGSGSCLSCRNLTMSCRHRWTTEEFGDRYQNLFLAP